MPFAASVRSYDGNNVSRPDFALRYNGLCEFSTYAFPEFVMSSRLCNAS